MPTEYCHPREVKDDSPCMPPCTCGTKVHFDPNLIMVHTQNVHVCTWKYMYMCSLHESRKERKATQTNHIHNHELITNCTYTTVYTCKNYMYTCTCMCTCTCTCRSNLWPEGIVQYVGSTGRALVTTQSSTVELMWYYMCIHWSL